MLWFKSLIIFITLYLLYNGIVMLGSSVKETFNNIKYHMMSAQIWFVAVILILFSFVVILLPYPLVLMLTGSIAVNPVIVGAELFAAVFVRHQHITNIL